ncbi:MAG: DNA polymerase [Patescibacteria group bacterium]|jgi:DNA polymerase I-like protein with 3'-5' exonuclease and polymerase domains
MQNRLVEYDFKQAEVCAIACYSLDPVLVDYITDLTSDMHKDVSFRLFLMKREEVTSRLRQIGKNKFTFLEFYGGWFKQAAEGIWKDLIEEDKQHLKKKGIRHLDDFVGHVETVEKWLWKKFCVYAEWRKETIREYLKKGYIDLLTGFRCYGPMKRNEIFSYRAQGTAFHWLMYWYIQVSKKLKEKRITRSYFWGEIHDAALGNIHPDDEKEIDYWVWFYGTQEIREHWPWINVPLLIEKEKSEIGGTWAKMEKCGVLKF